MLCDNRQASAAAEPSRSMRRSRLYSLGFVSFFFAVFSMLYWRYWQHLYRWQHADDALELFILARFPLQRFREVSLPYAAAILQHHYHILPNAPRPPPSLSTACLSSAAGRDALITVAQCYSTDPADPNHPSHTTALLKALSTLHANTTDHILADAVISGLPNALVAFLLCLPLPSAFFRDMPALIHKHPHLQLDPLIVHLTGIRTPFVKERMYVPKEQLDMYAFSSRFPKLFPDLNCAHAPNPYRPIFAAVFPGMAWTAPDAATSLDPIDYFQTCAQTPAALVTPKSMSKFVGVAEVLDKELMPAPAGAPPRPFIILKYDKDLNSRPYITRPMVYDTALPKSSTYFLRLVVLARAYNESGYNFLHYDPLFQIWTLIRPSGERLALSRDFVDLEMVQKSVAFFYELAPA